MSIKSELNKTAEYLRRTRRAILGRGGEIAETAGLKDLPDAIYNIPADTSLAFQTDEETAYEKVVPSGAEEYALLKSVGGMSYKTRNLIPYPYANTTRTIRGITFTDAGNGKIVLSGTWSGSTGFADFALIKEWNLPVGNYTLSGVKGGALYSYRIMGEIKRGDGTIKAYISVSAEPAPFEITDGDSISIYVRVSYDIGTVSNLVISPMLNEGTTALPYEPYFEGLRHTKITAFESEGANILPYPTEILTTTISGITYTDNGDGTYTASGTATGSPSYLQLRNINKSFPAGTYTFYGVSNGSNETYRTRYMFDKKTVDVIRADGHPEILDSDMVLKQVYLIVANGVTVDNLLYFPMILRGHNTYQSYKPYSAEPIDTYTIPEAVQSLEGYGLGVNDTYYNYIDYARKVFVQNVCKVVLDGVTQNKKVTSVNAISTGIYYGKCVLPHSGKSMEALICSHFTGGTTAAIGRCYIAGVNADECLMYNTNQTLTTVETWNEWLKEQYDSGNPVTIVYALAEPIETDISDLLTEDNFLKVEGGGVIRAVNEYKQDAPSTIKYTVKVGS